MFFPVSQTRSKCQLNKLTSYHVSLPDPRDSPTELYVDTPRNSPTTQLSSEIPPTPEPSHPLVRRFWGYIHSFLLRFSIHYCRWVGIPFDNQIIPLPFGLLLKWSDGTRLEEVRATGLPTPKIISYGEHPNTHHAPVSILMTRLPGREIGQVYQSLSPKAKTIALTEFKLHLPTIRGWASPWGDERVCSITGGAIRSIRVPNHTIGPCETPQEFHEYLLSAAYNSFASEAVYEEKLHSARKLQSLQRPGVKFTHGDIKHHNILVDEEGHITGLIDWESAGWYPEFGEYTTALRFLPKDFWWYEFLMKAGAQRYLEESECERALTSLTIESYVW
jgi:hypothetical protein